MWNMFWKWIIENYPILIIVAVIAAIVWQVARFYYTRFEKAEEKINKAMDEIKKLPCETHEIANRKILDNLSTIITYLKIKDSKAATLFSQKESPRKLNPSGQSLLHDCGGLKFIEQNKTELIESIAAKTPKTALDVENTANEVLVERLDSDIFNNIKEWVYKSPYRKVEIQGIEEEYAVTMNDICFVLSLPLRDMYLELHPELKAE